MNLSVTCYPTPGKAKAVHLCDLFARGVRAAGGAAVLSNGVPDRLGEGAAVFYGVTPQTAHLWEQAKAEGRDWYYIDNSYFDATRGTHYRITKNALQKRGVEPSDGRRRADLRIATRPTRPLADGDHIVVCLQSPLFMRTVAGITQDRWFEQLRERLKACAAMPIRLRGWNGNKKQQMATLQNDLKRAAVLATWSSAAAIEARIAGVPTVICSEQCAAHGITPMIRDSWIDTLADNQWTLAEIRDGVAWRALRA